MDKEIYVQLLTSSIEIINRELKDASITVKPHPREDPSLIQEIITRNHFLNVNISHQHAGVLSIDALFTISFWGSTVLDALAIGVPAVEYYIEAERFREAEPDGSSYKALGIDSVSNPDDLANFIRRVINSDYNEPPFVTELNREANSVGIDIVLGISD